MHYGRQTRLTFSCLEQRLKWVIGPLRSLVHVLGTVFLQLFGKSKPFLLSTNSSNCARSVISSIRYCDDSELVKHPRSGLPPTVLYKLSYLLLQLQWHSK